ncbi:VPS10 domain-containing receptor SorCS2 [Lates japonicus]|uniref:VPS10 domain-containing receptor SorCS2 n=1 Tax=Lates japonicus TaxID=270547 RepID=A0AAD3M3K2_LATJO|nr:VPS10 domain-containing receptor SorCS2 [Lates japonicus]
MKEYLRSVLRFEVVYCLFMLKWDVSPVFASLILCSSQMCIISHLILRGVKRMGRGGGSTAGLAHERDQMLFISTDEGSSFQRQSIAYPRHSASTLRKLRDELLAYCKEGRVGTLVL